MTLEAQNGAILFVWPLARVAGDFWIVHWQQFTRLKASVLSSGPQGGEKVAKQHLHVSLCGKHKYLRQE